MSDLDPYQTPESSLDSARFEQPSVVDAYGWPLASRWQRLGASIIDILIMGSAAVVILVPFILIGDADLSENLVDLIATVVVMVAFLLINGYWMAKDGQTIGKKALGIYMVGYESNRVLPLGAIIVKRYLPFWVMGSIPVIGNIINLINALFIFGQEKRCLHDLTAGTKVVAKPPLSYPAPAPPKWG